MNKKMLALENKIKNSRCQITKNILYYAIAPVVILLVGIILLCTVGFNGGTQLNGGSTFTIYINNDDKISSAEQYNIDEDYNYLCDKIGGLLAEGNLKAESFQKTQMDIEGLVAGGDAIKVIFKNSSSDKDKIELENEAIKNRVLAEFGYSTYTDAMTEVEHFEGTVSLSWALIVVASIIFAIALALVYMAFRTKSASWILGLLQVVIDLLLVASLMLICRVPVSIVISSTLISCAIISMLNVCVFYAQSKSNIDNGKYEHLKPIKRADETAKELAFKKSLIYVMLLVVSLLIIVMPVSALREAGLGILFTLIVTFYTSNFILPVIWCASYRPGKKKMKSSKEAQ